MLLFPLLYPLLYPLLSPLVPDTSGRMRLSHTTTTERNWQRETRISLSPLKRGRRRRRDDYTMMTTMLMRVKMPGRLFGQSLKQRTGERSCGKKTFPPFELPVVFVCAPLIPSCDSSSPQFAPASPLTGFSFPFSAFSYLCTVLCAVFRDMLRSSGVTTISLLFLLTWHPTWLCLTHRHTLTPWGRDIHGMDSTALLFLSSSLSLDPGSLDSSPLFLSKFTGSCLTSGLHFATWHPLQNGSWCVRHAFSCLSFQSWRFEAEGIERQTHS